MGSASNAMHQDTNFEIFMSSPKKNNQRDALICLDAVGHEYAVIPDIEFAAAYVLR